MRYDKAAMKMGAVVKIHAVFVADVVFIPVAITQKCRNRIAADKNRYFLKPEYIDLVKSILEEFG